MGCGSPPEAGRVAGGACCRERDSVVGVGHLVVVEGLLEDLLFHLELDRDLAQAAT